MSLILYLFVFVFATVAAIAAPDDTGALGFLSANNSPESVEEL